MMWNDVEWRSLALTSKIEVNKVAKRNRASVFLLTGRVLACLDPETAILWLWLVEEVISCE